MDGHSSFSNSIHGKCMTLYMTKAFSNQSCSKINCLKKLMCVDLSFSKSIDFATLKSIFGQLDWHGFFIESKRSRWFQCPNVFIIRIQKDTLISMFTEAFQNQLILKSLSQFACVSKTNWFLKSIDFEKQFTRFQRTNSFRSKRIPSWVLAASGACTFQS